MRHVRDVWYVVSWADDISPSEIFDVDVLDEPIGIYRTDQGHVVALEDRCVHRLVPLSLGWCGGGGYAS